MNPRCHPTTPLRPRPAGGAMMAVLLFTLVGGIAITSWISLLAARLQQSETASFATQRHMSWGNSSAVGHQYVMNWAFRDNVTRAASTTTLSGWGGQAAEAYTNLQAFRSTENASSATTPYPFNNLRPWPTSDSSVYFKRTAAASDNSQTEHVTFYSYLKTYPRPLLGDLFIVHTKPSGASGSIDTTDNVTVNGRVLIYDSAANVSGLRAQEVLNLHKTATNTTLNSGGSGSLLPQNFPASPVFTAGAGGTYGAVTDGSLNLIYNTNFTPGSLRHILEASSTGYNTLSTSYTSGVNIESDSDSGSSTSAVWVDGQYSPTYDPPTSSPYYYDWGSTLRTVTLLLKHSSLKHIRVVSGVEQLILKGQTNSTDYTSAGSLAPLIIIVEQEVRDIRFVGENNRPIILALGTGTGQVCYMAWSGTNVTGSGALRWRLNIVNQYRHLYLSPPSGNNVTITGSIRTNWSINCTDGSSSQRFTLNRETSPGGLLTLLPRDGWHEPYFLLQ